MAGMRKRLTSVSIAILLVPILGCGFSDYLNRSKAAEARANLGAICQGVASYVATERMEDGEVVSGVLPPAAPRAPATVPCGERVAWASDPAWDDIGFAPADPLYYSYEYEPDADGQGFTVRAIGDLDCDQTTSLYELHGTVQDGTADCSGEPTVSDEFE